MWKKFKFDSLKPILFDDIFSIFGHHVTFYFKLYMFQDFVLKFKTLTKRPKLLGIFTIQLVDCVHLSSKSNQSNILNLIPLSYRPQIPERQEN